ncbi:MAG: putative aminohydrolase SsnA [Spirochaetes bacterium]|nr:putative aminohydrolase SsnA [Spirochaetota bacterium]
MKPEKRSFILGNGRLITLGEENRIIRNGSVVIEDNLIKDLGNTEEMKKRYPDLKFLDVKGKVIMPGLVNVHHHLYSTFACGISTEPAGNFVEILEKLWWKLDRALLLDDIYYSSVIPLIKCIKSGTTTIIDHHASPNAIKGSLKRIAKACKKIGVRSVLCYEVTDRNGSAEAGKGIRENTGFIKKYGRNQDEMLGALFGFHASMTLSDKTIKKAVKAMADKNCGFHIHVAEDKADVEDSRSKHKKPVVHRLQDLGVLGEKTIAAHCIHVNEEEMDILAQTGTTAVNNPSSNMNNAVGTADILKLLQKGVQTGLGTDGMTSNMLEEVKTAFLIQHHQKNDPRVAFVEAVDMLTKTNPKIASRYFKHKVGVIEKDAFADIIVVDYYPFTPMNEDNFYGHFVYGIGSSLIDTTIINGKILYQNKKLKGINEEKLNATAATFAQNVWKRIQDQ